MLRNSIVSQPQEIDENESDYINPFYLNDNRFKINSKLKRDIINEV